MVTWRTARFVGEIGLLWGLTSVLGAVTGDQFSGAAAIYLPVGAVTALVIRRRIPVITTFLGVLLGQVLIGGFTANLTPATLANSVANTIEVVVVARILIGAHAQRFERERDIAWLALAAVLGALAGASVGTAYGVLVNGEALVPMFRAWFAADLLGIVLIVPGASIGKPSRLSGRQYGLAALLLVSSCILAWLAASPDVMVNTVAIFSAWYVMFLLIIIAGARISVPTMAVVQGPAAIAAFVSLADADPWDLMARQGLATLLALTLAGVVLGIRRQAALRLRSDLMGSDLFRLSSVPTAHVRTLVDAGVRSIRSISTNAAFDEIVGATGDDLMQRIDAHDADRVQRLFEPSAERRSAADVRVVLGGDDMPRLVHIEVVPVAPRPGDDASDEYLLVLEEVTAQRRMELESRQQARVDALTGLLNRRGITEDVASLLTRDGLSPFTLTLLDLDGLKDVNDRLGRGAGDELLRMAAQRLRACVPPADLVGRMGGDEFVIVSIGADGAAADAVIAKVRAALAAPFLLSAGECSGGCSIGWTAADSGDTIDTLLLRADNALYLEKTMRARHR